MSGPFGHTPGAMDPLSSAVDSLEFRRAGPPDEHLARILERVYPELRALAHRIRGRGGGETLNTTALVHEAYLKLLGASEVSLEGRAHFFSLAARAMRQILLDASRRRLASKRGGGDELRISLDDDHAVAPLTPEAFVALDEALTRLAAIDARRAAVVEQRFFTGLTTDEIAHVLGISTATVERDWRTARAWLATELR